MRTFIAVAALAAGVAAAAGPAAAQWGIGLELGVGRFGGTSRDTTGASVRPYRPTTVGFLLDRDAGRWRVGLNIMYAKTGLAGEYRNIAYAEYDAARVIELGLRASRDVVRLGAGVVLRLEAGPALDFWLVDGEFRNRWTGWGALAVEWPLGQHCTGALRAAGALSASVFDPEDVPGYVERLTTRRGSIAVALRYAL